MSAVKTQVSEPLNGSEINFSRPTCSYASDNAKTSKRSNEAGQTGDKMLDEILDLSFDEILQRDFPEGIRMSDIGPKVEIEDATKDYDWFDEKSDEEEDTEGLDMLPPLVSEAYKDEDYSTIDRNRGASPPGLPDPITWGDMEDGYNMNTHMHENDSDIDSVFDIEQTNRDMQESLGMNTRRLDSPAHAMVDRQFSGTEDIYLSDRFPNKFVAGENTAPKRGIGRERSASPPPQLANVSTPWSGTVQTAVMPTTQGMWVFVPKPPPTDPGRRRQPFSNGQMERNDQFHDAQQRPGRHRRPLNIDRSWNLESPEYGNRDSMRARTTSPRNRNEYFHYGGQSGRHSGGNTFLTNQPRSRRSSSSRSPRRRLFTESESMGHDDLGFGHDSVANPYQQIRTLKDMISSLESSIGALGHSHPVAPM